MDEEHVLSTDVRLALIFYVPTLKNLKAHIVFALFVISFVFLFLFCFFQSGLNHCFGQRYKEFNINMSIFMYYLLPNTKVIKYDSSINEIVFLSLLNHTYTILETC